MTKSPIFRLFNELKSTPRHLLISYLLVYLSAGFVMNEVGKLMGIAKFTYWWQVLTCYGLYMIPIGLLVRKMPFHMQYLWGLFSMCILEFLGYALGTSIALNITQNGNQIINNGNLLASIVDIKNFSLGMAIFFGLYYPALNKVALFVNASLFSRNKVMSTP